MKIKFDTDNLKKLQKIKNVIEEILESDFSELELTEENIKKAREMKSKFIELKKLYWDFTGLDIKIISSAGTELIKMV